MRHKTKKLRYCREITISCDYSFVLHARYKSSANCIFVHHTLTDGLFKGRHKTTQACGEWRNLTPTTKPFNPPSPEFVHITKSQNKRLGTIMQNCTPIPSGVSSPIWVKLHNPCLLGNFFFTFCHAQLSYSVTLPKEGDER